MNRFEGHAAGETAFVVTVDASLQLQIPWLTLFAFSTENWDRPERELTAIMNHNYQLLDRYGSFLHERDVRVRYMGFPDPRIPHDLTQAIAEVESKTACNRAMTLTVAFNYSGRREIVEIVQQALRKKIAPWRLSDRTLVKLSRYPDMPDVDLVIRTSGEMRLSNFMLLRLEYAELVFTDVLWPDFTQSDFTAAVEHYQGRSRRFGRIRSRGTWGAT